MKHLTTRADPIPADVRRQLEGGVETVEAALERHAVLHALLSGRQWRRRLREQPEALQTVLRHESALDEALPRIERRAQVDHWPKNSPVLTTVRDLRRLRERLERLVRQRLLEGMARDTRASSLVEGLTRLERLVSQPHSLELAETEVLLLEGKTKDVNIGRRVRAMEILFLLANGLVVDGGLQRALLFLGGLGPYYAYQHWARGTYWLTSERLVWKPRHGEPVQIFLRSIPRDGIRFSPGHDTLVTGERGREIRIHSSRESARLRSMLWLRLHPPLLGSAVPERLADVVCYPATFICYPATFKRLPTSAMGLAVLRPGYVAFLPSSKVLEVLNALTGSALPTPFTPGPLAVDLPCILEQLRHLPSAAEFDACVERAVKAAKGVFWKTEEVLRHDARLPVWKALHFQTFEVPTASLRGKVERSEQDTAERILAAWPQR